MPLPDQHEVEAWIEVRESLLTRLASLEPGEVTGRKVRPMYAHLLVALRRATVTIIRVITERDQAGCCASEKFGRREQEYPCFLWKGVNYLTKICHDTAFLDRLDDVQNYFGITFRNNPLAVEQNVIGEDTRLEHNTRGSRCHFPPRRRSFFDALDRGTIEFVHGVLSYAQSHERNDVKACSGHTSDGQGNQIRTYENADKSSDDAPKVSRGAIERSSRGSEEHMLVGCGPKEAERERAHLKLVLRRWSSLTADLKLRREIVAAQAQKRAAIRDLVRKRAVFVAATKNMRAKRQARLVAGEMSRRKENASASQVLLAFLANVDQARTVKRRVDAFAARVPDERANILLRDTIAGWRQASRVARITHARAEAMRVDNVTFLCVEAFGAWAAAAGLARRLKRRLDRADRALLKNILCAWALFSRHCAKKRLRRQERADLRLTRAGTRAWNSEILDEAFFNWANIVAAGKFWRLRLSARVFRGWQSARRTSTKGDDCPGLSPTQRKKKPSEGDREIEPRVERARHRWVAAFFECWAREAGLVSRLRRRLNKAELSLMQNAFEGWCMFARYPVRRRDARIEARAARRRDQKLSRAALWAWADITAAEKFFRIRLCHRIFALWKRETAGP